MSEQKRGTYLNQNMQWRLKEYAAKLEARKLMQSATGQELIETYFSLQPDVMTLLRSVFPLEDMQVLGKYRQVEFVVGVHVHITGLKYPQFTLLSLLPQDAFSTIIDRGPVSTVYRPKTDDLMEEVELYFPNQAQVTREFLKTKVSMIGRELGKLIVRPDGIWMVNSNTSSLYDIMPPVIGYPVPHRQTIKANDVFFPKHHHSIQTGNWPVVDIKPDEIPEDIFKRLEVYGKMRADLDGELHKITCVLNLLIEKKRTFEKLLDVWPDAAGMATELGVEAVEDGCTRMSIQEAEDYLKHHLSA